MALREASAARGEQRLVQGLTEPAMMRDSSLAEANGAQVAASAGPLLQPLSTRPPASESRSLSSDLALRCWITREICAIFFSTFARGTIALAAAIEPSTKGHSAARPAVEPFEDGEVCEGRGLWRNEKALTVYCLYT